MIAARVKSTVGPGVSGNIDDSIFFTPGVRWRFTPQKRISFYAAAGPVSARSAPPIPMSVKA